MTETPEVAWMLGNEEIPSDGTDVGRGFLVLKPGHYQLQLQAKCLTKKLSRGRSVFWGLYCCDGPITHHEQNLDLHSTSTAFGCLTEKEPCQSAAFMLPSSKTFYMTFTASSSFRKTKVTAVIYLLARLEQPDAHSHSRSSSSTSTSTSTSAPTSSPSTSTSTATANSASTTSPGTSTPTSISSPSSASPQPTITTTTPPSPSSLSPTPPSPSPPTTTTSPITASPTDIASVSPIVAPTAATTATATAHGFYTPTISLPQKGEQIYSSATGMLYTTYKTLGEGSFGIALLGSDIYGQPYVLKAAKPFKAQHEVESDWRKEAGLMMALNHPNIIRLHDAFAYNGLFWLVMEQAAGSLSSYVKALPDHRMPPRMVVEVAGQLLSGLEHIHLRGMIHRDIQLDNILYSRASAGPERIVIKISDFGIAKHLGYPAHAGLPAYTRIGREFDMSPGALLGYATNRADFYQVGMILYQLYTGHSAITSEDGPYYQSIPAGIAQARAFAVHTDLGDVIGSLLYVDENRLPSTARHAWALFSPVLHYMTSSLTTPSSPSPPASSSM